MHGQSLDRSAGQAKLSIVIAAACEDAAILREQGSVLVATAHAHYLYRSIVSIRILLYYHLLWPILIGLSSRNTQSSIPRLSPGIAITLLRDGDGVSSTAGNGPDLLADHLLNEDWRALEFYLLIPDAQLPLPIAAKGIDVVIASHEG